MASLCIERGPNSMDVVGDKMGVADKKARSWLVSMSHRANKPIVLKTSGVEAEILLPGLLTSQYDYPATLMAIPHGVP